MSQLDPADTTWWKSAVFYQIYPRSFSDVSGDGVGDLAGVIDKLGYLELLGIDAIWLSPIMASPMADHGYDVSDPRDVDPLFGDLDVFDELIAEAHERDIRVTMDLVPNHTSDQHEWFQAALAAAPGSPERERYIFRDGLGDDGDEPPNNWHSIFGGPAWTRVTEADGSPGQWYLHIFAKEQPDLNWENPDVFADLEKTLRFWLDRGVDGFRIDVAHGMAKPADLPDMDLSATKLLQNSDDDPRFNNYAVHEIHRKIRKVLDEYPGAANVGEIWVSDNERFAEYLRPDELHLGFNFRLAKAPFESGAIREAIENSLDAVLSVSGTPTWTLSNHDVAREVTRYAVADPETGALDLERGTRRARAMLVVEMALPGTVFLYNGSELGLPNVDDLPDDALQDPVWERSGRTERGRDGCRVPIPWEGTEPPFGFSATSETWLPIPDSWRALTVEAQLEDVGSMLSLYRAAIDLRVTRPEFTGEHLEWYGAPEGCLAFRRSEGQLVCALNAGDEPVPLPPGELLLVSSPLVDGMLAPDAAAWLV
ncbi:alpha-amylase [Nocardia farcinica]|nr:alpha-amylase [Nocardia farcinica]